MAELWHVCWQAEFSLPYTMVPGSTILVDAIRSAIDDWAEREMGARDLFYGRGHSIG